MSLIAESAEKAAPAVAAATAVGVAATVEARLKALY